MDIRQTFCPKIALTLEVAISPHETIATLCPANGYHCVSRCPLQNASMTSLPLNFTAAVWLVHVPILILLMRKHEEGNREGSSAVSHISYSKDLA